MMMMTFEEFKCVSMMMLYYLVAFGHVKVAAPANVWIGGKK
jgi:hypothetical protein